MEEPSGHALSDVLRALGRFLDAQGANHVEIVNRESFLAVSWETGSAGGEQRSYVEQDLEALREQAREMRKGGSGNPAGSLAELLRTLGQQLDANAIDINTIVQEPDGFRVSGVADGRYFRELYETEQLLAIANKRRIGRGSRNAEAPA